MTRFGVLLAGLLLASCQGAGSALHREIGRRIDSGEYLGAVTLVARQGRIVDEYATGHRDLARTAPMTTDTIFEIYSMTKTVATVAVLQLTERGAFSLDDPVARYLPEFATLGVHAAESARHSVLRPPARPLTIRHLLIHATGFAVGGGDSPAAEELLNRAALDDAPDLADYVRRLAAVPLALDPGSRYRYDGVNANVLGRLVEVASGLPFDHYLAERIFMPLGMKDTGFTVPLRERRRIAEMTTTDAEGRLGASPQHADHRPGESLRRYPSGAGGLYSTARDYARFAQMLLDGGTLDGVKVLERTSVGEMMTNQLPRLVPSVTEFRPGTGFGLGGEIVIDPARRGVLGPPGLYGWPGAASTWYFIEPSSGLIAILLMQHLPQGLPRDPPKPGTAFYNQAYRSFAEPVTP